MIEKYLVYRRKKIILQLGIPQTSFTEKLKFRILNFNLLCLKILEKKFFSIS